MKYLCMPDSFKGTLSSAEISAIMKQAILEADPGAEVLCIETADGGEGTLDAFSRALSIGQERLLVHGPFMEQTEALFAMNEDMMIIESAQVIGLHRVQRRDPEQNTSFGVGELIRHGLDSGASRILVALGGSCTNDGGAGLAAALGMKFLDENGQAFLPVGATLKDIRRIETSELDRRLLYTELTIMCDVDNPFYGPRGAAHVFAAQKGADEAMIERLDAGLKNLAERLQESSAVDLQQVPGAGAAGGIGGMLHALGGKLLPGIDIMLQWIDFEHLKDEVDIIFTGEGAMDEQSLSGKVPVGIARKAGNTPVYALVGRLVGREEVFLKEGLKAVRPIHPEGMPLSEAIPRSAEHLANTVKTLMEQILRTNERESL